MDINTERQLIEQSKTNPSSFGPLFDAYYPPIFRYVLKRVGDVNLALDITAETFYKALHNIRKFEWQGVSISAWLYKIATNEIRIYYRSKKYKTVSLEKHCEETGLELESDYNMAEELAEAQSQIERNQSFLHAQQVLAGLPVKYQEVIVLRFNECKKISEIALILGKKEGTVKSLLSRGLGMLRRQLSSQTQPFVPNGIVLNEGPLKLINPQESYEK
jgi:RNA polymerase sigma-70 factor, ECF subfamily